MADFEMVDQHIRQLIAFREKAPAALFDALDQDFLSYTWAVMKSWEQCSQAPSWAAKSETEKNDIQDFAYHIYGIIISALANDPLPSASYPLVLAMLHRMPLIAQDLLNNGSDQNIASQYTHNTPLIIAVMNNDLPMVKACLACTINPPDLTISNRVGKTALDLAKQYKRTTIIAEIEKTAAQQAANSAPTIRTITTAKPQAIAPATVPHPPHASTLTVPIDVPLLPLGDTHSSSMAPTSSSYSLQNEADVEKSEHWLFRAINYNNRMLFEGLFDFMLHQDKTWDAYLSKPTADLSIRKPIPDYKGIPRYVIGFLLRLILLPITSLIYNISRISLIALNPYAYRHNPAKMLSMFVITIVAAAALLAVGFLTPVFTQYSLQLLSGVTTGLTASVGSAIIVGAFLSIGLATVLHAVKNLAQIKNVSKVDIVVNGHAQTGMLVYLPPKHHFIANEQIPAPIQAAHQNILLCYNDYVKKPAIYGATVERKQFKSILEDFETINKAAREGNVDPSDYATLCTKIQFFSHTILPSWQAYQNLTKVPATLDHFEVNAGKIVAKNTAL